MRAEGRAERRRPRELFGDDERAHFVEADAAVLFRDIDAEEAEVAAALHEIARERPVLFLEAIELRQDLVLDELLRRLADQAMLVAQPLGCEDAVGVGRLEEPLAAAQNRGCSRRRHVQILSNIPAAPMPPPTHIVTMP